MNPSETLAAIPEARAYLRAAAPDLRPTVGVILGSGVGAACPELQLRREIACADVSGFPRPTVEGHAGRLILGRVPASGIDIIVLQGRSHYYEGHSFAAATFPVRVLAALGVRTLIVTSAVGSMRKSLRPGDIAVVSDHINLMGHNPLRAMHLPPFGRMFPDMTGAYAPALRREALARCRRLRIPAREGVYLAVGGPSYETPAEIRAFQRLGADVVGMSMVPETIVARQLGLEVLGLAWIANPAAGLGARTPLAHAEVLALGARVSERLRRLLTALLARLE